MRGETKIIVNIGNCRFVNRSLREMLKLIVLLLNLLLFVDRGATAPTEGPVPYPQAFKPNEEVTIKGIKCTETGKHDPLSTLVIVKNPDDVKHTKEQIQSDHTVHIDIKKQELKLRWIFEKEQDIEIDVKQGAETVGVLKTHIGNIMYVANHADKGLDFHDQHDSKKVVGKCHFVTSHMDSQSYIDLEWDGKGLAEFAAYYEIHYLPTDGMEELLYRSEISITPSDHNSEVQTDHNWKPARIEKEIFDPTLPGHLRIDVFDADDEEACVFVGSHTFPNSDLEKLQGKGLPMMKKTEEKGTMTLKKIVHGKSGSSMSKAFDQGWNLKFSVAIDFTLSNVKTRCPIKKKVVNTCNLHKLVDGVNQYTTALKAVGDVIAQYDDDGSFPVIGFGAKKGVHPYLFFLSNLADAAGGEKKHEGEIKGIDAMVDRYKEVVGKITLGEDTHFVPILDYIAKEAHDGAKHNDYQVLLIITDGIATDGTQTKTKIIDLSDKQMSIIIVGVGEVDFKLMREFDADDKSLVKRQPGSKEFAHGARDIVQFVAMMDFMTRNQKLDDLLKGKLGQSVLEELPEQILLYTQANPLQKH